MKILQKLNVLKIIMQKSDLEEANIAWIVESSLLDDV
jgi:hypothetical protein